MVNSITEALKCFVLVIFQILVNTRYSTFKQYTFFIIIRNTLLASGWRFLSVCQIQPKMFLKCFLENDGQEDNMAVEENVDGNIFYLFENFDI